MATWREVENFLTSNYKTTEKLGEHFYTLPFALNDGRTQRIFVAGLALDDPNWANLAFFSPFAKVGQISLQTLVDTMAENAWLGFSCTREYYTLKHIAPLANLDANEIEWPMQYITGAADNLERKLGLGDDL